ncbi:hypothetical protein HJFPF1_08489 [Paramyrothecium foliicola]|nr:hypothetical protein HJFPF1_08489 [Paramyrothecium foliicola]
MVCVKTLATTLVVLQINFAWADDYVVDVTNNNEREWFDRKIYDQSFSKANATSAAQDVIGYDFTQEYPAREVDGWRLSLSIAGNLPLYTSRSLTGARVQYSPPAQFRNSSKHESWAQCNWHGYVEFNETANVDGGCVGVLSDECHTALRDLVEAGNACYDGQNLPPACEGELGQEDNFLQADNMMDAGQLSQIIGGKLHTPGDFEYYDKMIRRVFVSIIGFSAWEKRGVAIEPVEDGERIPGILSCLRASQIDEDARSLEEAMEGVAAGTSVSMTMVFLAAILAAVGLL